MRNYDPGPPARFERIFSRLPDYEPMAKHFWFAWGPVFYRGRLDGTARVLCIGSDPGATERIAGRTLVGDAGQRVQGFLAKLGLTRSYVCLNAFAYALHPSHAGDAPELLAEAAHKKWRNALYSAVRSDQLQAVVAFGAVAREAVHLWPGTTGLHVVMVPHPSSRDEERLVDEWRAAIEDLRGVVTPDPDGTPLPANYGTKITEADYAPIPRRDLPFGAPPFLGDDALGRKASPPSRSSVSRPAPDDGLTLIWKAPAP